MDRRNNNNNDNRFARPNNNNNNNRDSYRPAPQPKVDREKTCPFLLRVFVSQGIHRQENDFKTLPLQDEHQIYTWRDTTLKELILLLRDTSNNLRIHPFAKYSVRIVYFDTTKNSFHIREFGSVLAKDLIDNNTTTKDKEREVVQDRERPVGFDRSSGKTFEEARFVIGDYIDIAYLPNGTSGSHNPFDRSIQTPGSILGRSLDSRNNSLSMGGGRGGGNDNRRASETLAKRDTIWASSTPSGPRAGNNSRGADGSGAPGAWGRMSVGDRGENDRGGDRNDRGGGDRNGDRNFNSSGRNDRDRNDQGRDNGRDGGRDGGRGNGRDNGRDNARDSKGVPGEGWGARRDRENGLGNKRDEPPHRQERRRSSRSRSPAPRQTRRDRSNSPEPRKNDNRRGSREKGQDRERSVGMDVA